MKDLSGRKGREVVMARWLQPVLKLIVVCEDVLPGPANTGNLHLMNVFASIRPRSDPPFPYLIPQLGSQMITLLEPNP